MQQQRRTSQQNDTNNYDAMAKLAIIGDSSVGKTNILLRYMNAQTNLSHVATIGIDFKVKSVTIDGYKIKLQIWDTAGQERFRNLTGTVYQGAQAILLVYSVTDRNTFTNLSKWIKDVSQNAPPNVTIGLAGNKSDLKNERVVSQQQGREVAKSLGNCVFFETSAKENANITELFEEICKKIKQKMSTIKKAPKKQIQQKSSTQQTTQQKKSSNKPKNIKLSKQKEKQQKKKNCC